MLNAATNRLELTPGATRVFNVDGVDIEDPVMLDDADMLFVSAGADFEPPPPERPDINDASNVPNDHGVVGGDDASGDGTGSRANSDGYLVMPVADDEQEEEEYPRSSLPSHIGGYRVGDLLGKGGFGEVRIGEHQVTCEKVALKFLQKSAIANMGAAERTTIEIQCLMALKYTHIIRLLQHLEYVSSSRTPFTPIKMLPLPPCSAPSTPGSPCATKPPPLPPSGAGF